LLIAGIEFVTKIQKGGKKNFGFGNLSYLHKSCIFIEETNAMVHKKVTEKS